MLARDRSAGVLARVRLARVRLARVRRAGVLVTGLMVTTAACAASEPAAAPASDAATVTAASAATTTTTAETGTTPSTTSPPTSTTTSTTTTSTTTTSTTTTSTTTATTSTTAPAAAGESQVELGRSVEDRPIVAIRRGEPGGTAVLVVGVIHGDEDAGAAIVDELLRRPVPDGVELWLVPSVNPDGQAGQYRHNANGVDLNRNFPVGWGPIAAPGDWQYAGPSAASEPETQAMLRLAELVQPDLTLWYHQDLFRINPSTGREGQVRERYASLTGLPIVPVEGGRYTGTASTWSRSIADEAGVGFTVELGPTLSAAEAAVHADAVLTVAAEL